MNFYLLIHFFNAYLLMTCAFLELPGLFSRHLESDSDKHRTEQMEQKRQTSRLESDILVWLCFPSIAMLSGSTDVKGIFWP